MEVSSLIPFLFSIIFMKIERETIKERQISS